MTRTPNPKRRAAGLKGATKIWQRDSAANYEDIALIRDAHIGRTFQHGAYIIWLQETHRMHSKWARELLFTLIREMKS